MSMAMHVWRGLRVAIRSARMIRSVFKNVTLEDLAIGR